MIHNNCIVDTLHDAGIVNWWLNIKLTICILQAWVHDACIICTIACNGIRTMIFLIVIVNPEYHIIVLIARDSVLQFSSCFCCVILQFCIWGWRFHNLPSFCNCSCKLRPCTWTETRISTGDPHIWTGGQVFTTANSTK